MRNPWMKSNPLLSMWLSGANTMAATTLRSVRGKTDAILRRQASLATNEAARQIALLEAGERVVQETRHWNEQAGSTSSMRSKEEANDYRYFLEPDLVPIVPDDAARERVRSWGRASFMRIRHCSPATASRSRK